MPCEKKKTKTYKIAITGPPAAGKTTILSLFKEYSIPVFSADEEVRKLSRPCQKGYHLLVKKFGREILSPEEELDRRKILEKMLTSSSFKRDLEALLHPLVRERLQEWFEKHEGESLLVAEIPLLFQAGWERLFDLTIFISCSERTLLERLQRRLKDRRLAEMLLETYLKSLPSGKRAFILSGELLPEELKSTVKNILQSLEKGEADDFPLRSPGTD